MSSLRARRIARNPFAFPGGNWGYNKQHPAAGNILLSAVNNGAALVNVLTGKQGTVGGSPTQKIRPDIGCCTNVGSGTGSFNFSGMSTASELQFTNAAIVVLDGTGANAAYFQTDSGSNGHQGYIPNGVLQSVVRSSAAPTVSSGITLATNTPYFIAYSRDVTAGGTDFVVMNMATGVLTTAFVSGNTGSVNTSGGTFALANVGVGTTGMIGSMATFMCSNVRTSASVLRAWAFDPWSFWYPN